MISPRQTESWKNRSPQNLRKTEQTLIATKTTALIDQYLTNLSEAVEKDPIKSLSIAQTAESAMAQLWGLNLAGLPEPLQKKIDSYPTKLKAGVDRIAEVKSAPHLDEIQKQMQRAKDVSVSSNPPLLGKSGPLQGACDIYEDCFTISQQEYAQVSSETGRKQAELNLKAMRDLITASKKKQFNTYQKWVVDKIQSAFDAEQRERWTTKEDVMRRFHDCMIVNIDQSSLTN